MEEKIGRAQNTDDTTVGQSTETRIHTQNEIIKSDIPNTEQNSGDKVEEHQVINKNPPKQEAYGQSKTILKKSYQESRAPTASRTAYTFRSEKIGR